VVIVTVPGAAEDSVILAVAALSAGAPAVFELADARTARAGHPALTELFCFAPLPLFNSSDAHDFSPFWHGPGRCSTGRGALPDSIALD
jgi:hypothetical protein